MASSQVEISSYKTQGSEKSNTGVKNKQKNHEVSSVHGPMYQVKLLMLLLLRGVSHGYSFRLGKEIKEAGKFDDLVFEYTENGEKVYRLLQAKHKLDEYSKKIRAHNLLTKTKKKSDYYLTKYCESYLSYKKSNLFKDGKIKDVIIYTNLNFDFENLKRNNIQVQKIEDEDDILDVVVGGEKQPQCYKFCPVTFGERNEFSDDEVKDFLDHLVFAVNQPNEQELGIIIKEELGKRLDLDSKTREDVYNKLHETMLNWFKDPKSDRFFSSEEGKRFFEEAKRGMPIWFGVRDPVESFVGRDEQLCTSHNLLQNDDATVVSQAVSISGLGGIGKSELVRKYIIEHSQNYDNKIVWINAESYQSLTESFRRLACDQLGKSTKNVNGEERQVKSILEDVYKFFSKSRSLFVFDNAGKYRSQDEFDHGIDKFLLPRPPNNENRPHVIITSRNQNWPEKIKVLSLNAFKEEEARIFIKNSLNIENDAQEKEISELSKELQNFPLALQQAVSYIRVKDNEMKNINSGFQIKEYLERFKEKAKELLNFEFPDDSANEYTKTTYITWNVTIDVIRQKENGEDALEILNIISYLGPENIPVKILLNSARNEEKLGSAIELLKQYSMVNSEHGILNIHRLVQHVTRIKLENQKKEENALISVLELFEIDNVCSKIVNHAIIAWNYSSRYSKLIKKFDYVSSYISNELINSGKYEEASLFGLKVLELFKTLPLDDPMSLPIAENNTAVALLMFGKYDLALEMFEKQLDYYQMILLESNHPLILRTRTGIAGTKAKQGKYNEALIHYNEILEIQEKSLPENDPDILSTKTDIAQIFVSLGKYDEALEMCEELRIIQNTTLGENHPQSLKTKSSIGVAHLLQVQYNEALKILQEVLGIQEVSLEKDHPDVLDTKTRIAGVLLQQSKYNDAFKAYQDILTIKRENLEENHPDILRIRCHLAEILRLQSKYYEALKALKEIFKQQKNIQGDHHPDTLATQHCLACTFHDQGKFTEALENYEEVLKKRKVILGEDHIDTLKVRKQIAKIFSKQEKYNEAIQMHKEIFAVQKRVLGLNHWNTQVTNNDMGLVLYCKNEFDEALEIFQEVFNTLEKISPNHPGTLNAKSSIALVFSKQGKEDEALKIFKEVHASQVAIFGEEHHYCTKTKYNMANLLFNQGKYYEALTYYQEVYPELRKVSGQQNEQTLEVNNKIQSLMLSPKILETIVTNKDYNKIKNNLKIGITVNSKDIDGFTLLNYAVKTGNTGMIHFLLENGADVNQISKKGNTPLHLATLKGFEKIVEILLQHASHNNLKEFINAKTTSTGTTSLHVAVEKGFLEIVVLLLKRGAIYDIKNKDGKTPLDFSKNPNISNLLELTAELFEGAENGNDCIIKKLKELEPEKFAAVTSARNNERQTLLEVATINNYKNIARDLLEILNTPE